VVNGIGPVGVGVVVELGYGLEEKSVDCQSTTTARASTVPGPAELVGNTVAEVSKAT
jgi:hypothetical protein